MLSPDHKVANLAFGIRLMPLDRQKKVIDDISSKLDPPPGVTADVVGLPVLAAEANHELSSHVAAGADAARSALVAVFLVLLVVRRRVTHAAVP